MTVTGSGRLERVGKAFLAVVGQWLLTEIKVDVWIRRHFYLRNNLADKNVFMPLKLPTTASACASYIDGSRIKTNMPIVGFSGTYLEHAFLTMTHYDLGARAVFNFFMKKKSRE